MQPTTHLLTNTRLVGSLVRLGPGESTVRLAPTSDMEVDVRGLVHGGFIFGLADYAAMLAVNDPNVVLGAAETRFLAPVTRGVTLVAHARLTSSIGRKRAVEVRVERGSVCVMTGKFTCFVLDAHVLGD